MSAKPSACVSELCATLTRLDQFRKQESVRRTFVGLQYWADAALNCARFDAGTRGGKTGAKLLAALRAVHPCSHAEAGGFVQLPTIVHVREWKCTGCGAIVTLPRKGA